MAKLSATGRFVIPERNPEAAAALTEAAINLGYVTRSRPVPGAALLSWASNPAETPLWAAQTALTLMLSIGWKPESNPGLVWYVCADIQS